MDRYHGEDGHQQSDPDLKLRNTGLMVAGGESSRFWAITASQELGLSPCFHSQYLRFSLLKKFPLQHAHTLSLLRFLLFLASPWKEDGLCEVPELPSTENGAQHREQIGSRNVCAGLLLVCAPIVLLNLPVWAFRCCNELGWRSHPPSTLSQKAGDHVAGNTAQAPR